jgi:hypothetical protein
MTPLALATRPHPTSGRSSEEVMLPMTVRYQDGREESIERPVARHRAIHLGVLHSATNGHVELAAGYRDETGKLEIYTRNMVDHFFPGGAVAGSSWRIPLLSLAEKHHARGEEVFVGVTPRALRRGVKDAVHWTRCLWMDIDPAGHRDRIDALLDRFPAHLEIATAGGEGDQREHGHRHLIWLLSQPQVARTVTDLTTGQEYFNAREVTQGNGKRGRPRIVGYRDLKTQKLITNAEAVDWIERWNLRLIHHLGHTAKDGKESYIADAQCRERARVLRLAGTVNLKTGRYAHIARLDLALAPYDTDALVGELDDPPRSRPVRRRDVRDNAYDPYRLIPTSVYFPFLANVEIPLKGNIHCPSPTHPDVKESCSVDEYVFKCFGCGAQGTIYDLASLMRGGPTGDALAADEASFRIVGQEVRERCRHLL